MPYIYFKDILKMFFFGKKKIKKTEIKEPDSSIFIDIGADNIKLAFIDIKKRISYNKASVSLKDLKSGADLLNKDWEIAAEKAIDELLDNSKYSGIPIHFTRRSGKNIFLRSLSKKPQDIAGGDIASQAPVRLDDLYFDTRPFIAGDGSFSLVGMASGEFIIRSLNLFGKHKWKVVSFIPSSLSFVNRYRNMLKDQDKEALKLAGLFLDIGFTGTLFLAVSPEGVLYERHINIGFFQIAQKLMEKMDLDFQTVRQMLETETVLDTKRKEEYEALDEILNQLALEIKKSISYFSSDRTLVPVHKTLFIGGGAGLLKNLDIYLNEKLGLKVKFISGLDDAGTDNGNPAFDTLSGLINGADPLEINLLRNTENLKLKFDDEDMVFQLDRFVKRERKAANKDVTKRQSETPETAIEPSKRPRRGRARPSQKTKKTGFFSLSLKGKEKDEVAELTEEEAAQKKKNRMIGTIIVVLLFFWGFKGYGHIEKLQKKRKNMVSRYFESQERLDSLIRQKSQASSSFSADFAETKKLDKNFWVEKLLYVAAEMSDKIWLSSINLEKGRGEKEKEQQKLVIKGLVRKSTEGHLKVVSKFMRELINNKKFMRDFNDVTFEGIQMSAESEKVTFTLICWYQRNVNISEDIEEDEEKSKGDMKEEIFKNLEKSIKDLDKVDKLS